MLGSALLMVPGLYSSLLMTRFLGAKLIGRATI